MKKTVLLHNPGAGGGEHDIEEIRSLIERNGFECSYSSVKEKGWKDLEEGIDFLIVAGGDGTVKKIAKRILEQKKDDKKWPIALLPMGTANNIATTLNIKRIPREELIRSWHNDKRLSYDVGKISGVDDAKFFFENFGYGLFPHMIEKMMDRKLSEGETPEQNIKASLEMFRDLVYSYPLTKCTIETDGMDHSGKFLMAEIMLSRLIGPNVLLSPHSQLNDGLFDIVLLTENDKEKFSSYLNGKINGMEEEHDFARIKAKKIKIKWSGDDMHVDDTITKIEAGKEVKIEIVSDALQFLVP